MILALTLIIGGLILLVVVIVLVWFYVVPLVTNQIKPGLLSAKITLSKDQNVPSQSSPSIIHFDNETFDIPNNTQTRYIIYFTKDSDNIKAGSLQYNGTDVANFTFSATIDAGDNQTQIAVASNGKQVTTTKSDPGNKATTSLTLDMNPGDTIAVQNIYLNKKTQWKTGSEYTLQEN